MNMKNMHTQSDSALCKASKCQIIKINQYIELTEILLNLLFKIRQRKRSLSIHLPSMAVLLR